MSGQQQKTRKAPRGKPARAAVSERLEIKPEDIDPHHDWSRLNAHGVMNVDFEERVDFRRLHRYRLGRARQAVRNSTLGALLCFDNNNIRYITSTAIGEWSRDKFCRFAVLRRTRIEAFLRRLRLEHGACADERPGGEFLDDPQRAGNRHGDLDDAEADVEQALHGALGELGARKTKHGDDALRDQPVADLLGVHARNCIPDTSCERSLPVSPSPAYGIA